MGLRYIAVVGITYTDRDGEKRAEVGEKVPGFVIKRSPWLLEQGCVIAEAVASASEEVESV